MYKKLVLILFMLLQGFCFAYEKQNDEYSCGAISAYNLINENYSISKENDYKTIYKLLNTDKNGTTIFNLCKGLDKYLSKQKLTYNIYYYGIKKVKKYKSGNTIDLDLIQKFYNNDYKAIINIGIYKNISGSLVRQYGHYVNLVSIDNTKLKIFDPYDKKNEYTYWTIEKHKIALKNINDNEKYEKVDEYFFINECINYLKPDEQAIINGIVFVHIGL